MRVSSALIVSVALLTAACATSAGSLLGGGDLFDAEPPAAPAEPATDAAMVALGDTGGGPVTWTALYQDYFGPAGVASCSGTVGACHGEASAAGYGGSLFLCPPGDATGCYTSLTSASVIPTRLLDPGDGMAFDTTGLFLRLRKTQGANSNAPADPMPKSPPYSFTVTDVAKISQWVAAGAKND